MAIDMSLLKRRGISSGSYKKIFDGDRAKYPTKIRKLVDLLADRNRNGIEMSLAEWRAYAAVDLAYEVPFNQTTPTLVQNILSKRLDAAGTLQALKDWGLSESELFLDIPGANGQVQKLLNPPVFFQIYIPIVKAYVANVLGQIFNERNTSPLLPYNPLKESSRNRALCEILTDTVEVMSTNLGYSSVLKQSIQQMLKYGIMLTFPREEWYCEEQRRERDNEDGSVTDKRFTVKEGLRYTHPHPTKFFYDLRYPLTSLNTDTGTEFIGYWHIKSYGDIFDDRMLWNRQSIFAGTNWFQHPGAGKYFDELFPCRAGFPISSYRPKDREDKAAQYTTANRDHSVFVVEQFAKIVPKDWGLGRYKDGKLVDTYDCPVWHKFTMAGDDTVIWAEPCAYTPSWFMGYDYDEMAGLNSSLGLELIPYQDHLGMILSQMGLTARQNLMNVIFYDNQIVDKEDIAKLQNSGEAKYRSTNFISFDSLKRKMAGTDINRAFIPVQLTKASIQELYQLIGVVLNMMDRVLGIASQEAGAAATHQQSKEEVIRTGKASASRRALTSASVDEGIDAWKRQLYQGWKAYGDRKVSARVSSDIENVEQHLDELGFTIEQRTTEKLWVKGNKSDLALEHFARANEGPQKPNESAIAQVLFQTLGVIAGQPDLHQAIGVKNMLKIIEQAAIMAGAPRGFKLAISKDKGEEPKITPELQQALQALAQTILQTVTEKVAQPAAQQAAKTEQEVQALQVQIKQLEQIYKVAGADKDKAAVKQAEAAQKMQLKQVAFVQDEQRKEEKHKLELQRETEEAAAKLALEAQVAKGKLEIQKIEASNKPVKEPTPA